MTQRFTVKIHRYTDPDRTSLARRAAIFKGKTDYSNVKRPLQFVGYGHMSIFRGESISVELYTKKPVYDHIVTYTTIAGRYCAGLRANEGVDVDAGALQDVAERIRDEYLAVARDQDDKTRLENARDIAPMSVMVRYDLEINLLTLIHMFKDRQWVAGFQRETGEVFEELWRQVHAYDPVLWDVIHEHFGPHVWRWQNSLRAVRGWNLNRYLNGEERKPVTVGEFLNDFSKLDGVTIGTPLEEAINALYCRMPNVW